MKKFKGIVRISIIATLMLTMMIIGAGTVLAENESVTYIDDKGAKQTCDSYTIVDDSTFTWGETGKTTWYVVNSNITVSQGYTVAGNVHLILMDGCELSATGEMGYAGIEVSGEENSIDIYAGSNSEDVAGTGTLKAGSASNGGTNDGAAGIGGNNGCSGNNITINGGIVYANGGGAYSGAGIGGGNEGSGINITINGGTVNASGYNWGAGIGGGNEGDGTNITIHDGTVNATGGGCAAGIGGGDCGEGSKIAITGGTVTAIAGEPYDDGGGSCIGGGRYYDSSTDIKISKSLLVKTGSEAGDAVITADDRGDDTDIATQLAGKKYAKAGQRCTVKYYSDGKLEESLDVIKGEKITDPTEPDVKLGYGFEGWYKENTLENKWNLDDKVLEDTSLYAKWVPNGKETPNYLTFKAVENNSEIALKYDSGRKVQYKLEDGDWQNYTKGNKITLSIGDQISFRGRKVKTTEDSHFEITGGVTVSGSVTSLTDSYGGDPDVVLTDYCYSYMFSECEGLLNAPALPATTLEEGCYYGMFGGCFKLTRAPALPATTLAEKCYYEMFDCCIGLKEAPVLPATTLAEKCYVYMFYNCTSLTNAPVLPARTLAADCYGHMFECCEGLLNAPELPAQTLANGCYYRMFYGCTALTGAPALPAQTLANDCYYRMFYGCTALTGAPALPAQTLADECYYEMFSGCTALTGAPALPAQTLADECYYEMFYGCTALTGAPALPAQTLADECYYGMFTDCTNLIDAPALPAQTLADECYYEMFSGCTALTGAPALSAQTLADECYYAMFSGCTALTGAPALPATTLAGYCYEYMFYDCESLTTAPALPATTLADYCYNEMFYGCESLINAPALPATTLADYCYYAMFSGCTSLTTAPALPAQTLANGCYYAMFSGCTSLKEAPELPATTLAESCYYEMFDGCTSMKEAPELPATTLAESCYYEMFDGCTALTYAPKLPATTLEKACYEYMFCNCVSLTYAPELPATTLADYCYFEMFFGCTKIKISSEQSGNYPYAWAVPKDAVEKEHWAYSMFSGTGGSFTWKPEIGKTYYQADKWGHDISRADVAEISSETYSGDEIKPEPVVTYKNKTLEKGKDYTLDYTENKNAGEATIRITGINDFKGEKTTTFTINKKQLTISEQDGERTTVAETKVYDGSTAVNVTNNGTLKGVEGTEDVSLDTVTANYEDKNAGTDKTVTVSYTIKGTAASNYLAPADAKTFRATITRKQLTISENEGEGTTVAGTKVYDGSTTAKVTNNGTLKGVVEPENVELDKVTAAYADANVGTGKSVTVEYTIKGDDKDNYSAPVKNTSFTADITPAEVTLSDVSATGITYGQKLSKSTISGTAKFDNNTVTGAWSWKTGETKPSVSDSGETGYTVVFTPDATKHPNLKATETSIKLTVNKAKVDVPQAKTGLTYNGTEQTGVVLPNGETRYTLTGNTGTAAKADYSAKATLSDKDNYEWNLETPTADDQQISWAIAKSQLTVEGTTVAGKKTYDGSTSATVTNNGTLKGVVGTENVVLDTVTATYDDANVGTGKSVTVEYTIKGDDSANYSAPVKNTNFTADITPAAVTLSDVSATDITYGQKLSESTISGTAKFDNNTVTGALTWKTGETKPSVSDSQKTEYTVVFTPDASKHPNLKATETSIKLTINKAKVNVPQAKTGLTYNGTEQIGVVLPEGETRYTLAGNTGTNAKADYSATATLSDKNNCEWNLETPTTDDQQISWAIAKKQLTISEKDGEKTAVAGTKTYDGNTAANVTNKGTLTGVEGTDNVELETVTANYEDKKAGTNKTVTVSYTINGTAASNYLAPAEDNTFRATITKIQLTISENEGEGTTVAETKTYDGSTTAEVTNNGTLKGVVGTENVELDEVTAAYADANIGEDKKVTVEYTIKGDDSANYNAPVNNTSLTADITPATVSLTKVSAADITYGKKLSDSKITGTAEFDNKTVTGTWNWKEGETKPEISDSQETEYTVVFTPDAEKHPNLKATETFIKLTVTHCYIATPKKAATCTKAGNTAYWYCPELDKYYSDAKGETEIAKGSWVVKATGHSYRTVSAGNGCTYKQCSRCGYKTAYTAPSYVKSFKVSKGKKCFTAKWKKQSKKNLKKFNGYQIRYSTRSDMAGAKYKKISKKKTSIKITKLGKKTKYYVQLRTYTGSFYSGWSTKTVVTK